MTDPRNINHGPGTIDTSTTTTTTTVHVHIWKIGPWLLACVVAWRLLGWLLMTA